MTYKRRVETLRVLIDGHHLLSNSAQITAITGELNRLEIAGRLSTDRGWLLSLLHTTRALDTTLVEICVSRSWARPTSIGAALHTLADNQVIAESARHGYQQSIARPRNKYMHTAGAMPQKIEADRVLAEMQSLLARVLAVI